MSSEKPAMSEKHPSNEGSVEQRENFKTRTPSDDSLLSIEEDDAKLANPLAGIPREQLIKDGAAYANANGLGHLENEFRKGAVLAANPMCFDSFDLLTEEERTALRLEQTKKWKQPFTLYWLVVMCSVAAAVQGMDESVINGANLLFPKQFGIDPKDPDTSKGLRNGWLVGLVNSSPYIASAVLGCWLTEPLNRFFGRRGAIFLTATVSFLCCIWSGITNSWPHLFAARFVLGLGIGPKSTTVPVFGAECAPAPIRGALVMMWQMWTAFGIMIGYVADLAFFKVPDKPHITGLNWRLMLSSAGLPALFVMAQVYGCPESPRWLLGKGRHADAYKSFERLRGHPIQAARDLYLAHVFLDAENEVNAKRKSKIRELFSVKRNRRAALASFIVMFMQQFCGVNAIAYYSSNIFLEGGFSQIQALAASLGFGIVNFVFALPAVYTIDTFGRRNLLLTTFPLMALFLLMTGFAFFIPESERNARIGVIALGIYLFTAVYSPGEGPVPFTYSAEAFPLYVRDVGMSFATATTWFFNAVIALITPSLITAFTSQGMFGWYAGWNIVGFFLVLLFVPETKALTLEELDQVFNVGTRHHAAYQLKAFPIFVKRNIFRMKGVEKQPPLYKHEGGKAGELNDKYVPEGEQKA